MSFSPLESPVVVDGVVSDEKLAQLLGLQAEYPELDYKGDADLQDTGSVKELAKDIGAMQVLGGYIIIGVDDSGTPTGALDDRDLRGFDEASLTQKMVRFLPEPLTLRTRATDVAGHKVVVIFVGPHPDGCAFFKADGTYQRNGREEVAFRKDDVFWRGGTSSTRLSQAGLRNIIERRVAGEKGRWFEEQRQLRRQEREDLEAASSASRPLGSVNLDMTPRELSMAALELARADDTIGLQYLVYTASARAQQFIQAGDIEVELGDLLDKLVCLAATFIDYEQWSWFERIIALLRSIYPMPLAEGDAQRFGYNVHIPSDEPGPRVWLQLMVRLYALGGLAVRRRQWSAIRTVTLQLPERLMDYETNWLRHAITMMSRAQHLQGQDDNDRTVELSLLSLAQAQANRLDCLRTDGVGANDDELLTSIAQFDILSNLVAVADSPDEVHSGRTFYPNFARFHQDRVQPLVNTLLADDAMRDELELSDDAKLARALQEVGVRAENEGARYRGFAGWELTPVGVFIDEHPRTDAG